MADKIYLKTRFVYRTDTLENWETKNPLLERGEPSFVIDGKNGQFMKIGNGMHRWNELPYVEFWKEQANKISTITLLSSKWEGTGSPYAQVVNVVGATENSKIDLNPTVEQLSIFHNKDITFVVENADGVITVYCIGQKPANDYTIQATITEVLVNE